MAQRKTLRVDVEKMLTDANEQLARTDDFATQKFKAGVCVMIEKILHASGNYQGFNHKYWLEVGWKKWNDAGCPETWPQKEEYIYGEGGKEGKNGEYTRFYYSNFK